MRVKTRAHLMFVLRPDWAIIFIIYPILSYPVPSSEKGWVAANFTKRLQGVRFRAFWTAVWMLSPVQSLMLSSQVAFGWPLDRLPSTLPSRIVLPSFPALHLHR